MCCRRRSKGSWIRNTVSAGRSSVPAFEAATGCVIASACTIGARLESLLCVAATDCRSESKQSKSI